MDSVKGNLLSEFCIVESIEWILMSGFWPLNSSQWILLSEFCESGLCGNDSVNVIHIVV